MKRRTALGAFGAAATASVFGVPTARGAQLKLNPFEPADVLMITRKLAHTIGDDVVHWWAKLSRMVMLEKKSTPMWDVWVGAILKTNTIDDQGGYETTAISMVFYTDVKTGQYMEKFNNPITGKTVDIGYFPAKPRTTVSTLDDKKGGPQRPGYEVTSRHPLGPAMIIGDDVWVRDDDVTFMEPMTADAGPAFRVQDWNTYHGSVTDVANPEVLNAPATWHFNDILSFPPWLEMSDHPGDFMSRGFGRKTSSFDAFPKKLTGMIKMRHPEILKDPRAALDG